MKKQDGYVLVFVLSLMPLAVAILCVVLGIHSLLLMDSQNQHLCRTKVLKIQQIYADAAENLINLNPLAEQLRAEKLAAEAEVASTALTPFAAAAIAHLESVQARQLALAAQQKRILLLSQLQVQKKRTELISELSRNRILSQVGFPTLKLTPTPKFDLTPSYEEETNFSEKQTLRVSWSTDIRRILPLWAARILSGPGMWNRQCAATIQHNLKGGDKWQPRLVADK